MAEDMTPGEHIRKLRTSLGSTQAEFGNQFGVTQSRISEWEGDGPTRPSIEVWMKMADLALRTDVAEALFFWIQTDISSKFLSSVSEAILRAGDPEFERVLVTAEEILRARIGSQRKLEAQGKIVLVPPYAQGKWGHQASLPPMALDGNFVSSVASTYYLVAAPGLNPTGCVLGDRIVFDTAEAPTRRVARFVGQSVLLRTSREIRLTHDVVAPEGLFWGRLAIQHEGPAVRWVAVEPRAAHLPGAVFGMFTPESNLPPHDLERIRRGTRLPFYRNVVPGNESEAIESFTLPEGCEIIGRFIALFSGEGTKRSDDGSETIES